MPGLRAALHRRTTTTKLVIHVSNFRPVKRDRRGDARSSRASASSVPARLLLVGDGPELGTGAPARRASSASPTASHAVGAQEEVVPLLSVADVFLLPSAQESFGLAALEAMACEVPVVASRVGGLPEVIEHGVTGFLHPPDDLDGMAASAVALLTDPALHQRVAQAACRRVRAASSAPSASCRCTRRLTRRRLGEAPVPATAG